MPAALSFESRLFQWLELRQMPTAVFAEVAKLDGIEHAGQARLFQAFTGKRDFPIETAIKLEALKNELETLAKSFEPFILDLRNPKAVFDWLCARRNDEVYSVVVKLNDSKAAQQ
jgi:hypothetical protein